MVMTNKDIEEFEKQMENMKKEVKPMTKEEEYRNADVPMPNERGPNDLEQRIEDLMRISLSHQNLNADLRKEVFRISQRIWHTWNRYIFYAVPQYFGCRSLKFFVKFCFWTHAIFKVTLSLIIFNIARRQYKFFFSVWLHHNTQRRI